VASCSKIPFDPRELRRLSVAADPQRTLIGVRRDGEVGLRIWGLINSGTRWLRDVQGGRRAGAPLPPAPVVHVSAPGSIEAYKGHELVGKLQGGRLSGSRLDPFESEWLPDQFSRLLEELVERHEAIIRYTEKGSSINFVLSTRAVVNEIGPPLRCLLLSITP
jgi:hypothetical protein